MTDLKTKIKLRYAYMWKSGLPFEGLSKRYRKKIWLAVEAVIQEEREEAYLKGVCDAFDGIVCENCRGLGTITSVIPAHQQGGEVVDERVTTIPCWECNDEE